MALIQLTLMEVSVPGVLLCLIAHSVFFFILPGNHSVKKYFKLRSSGCVCKRAASQFERDRHVTQSLKTEFL